MPALPTRLKNRRLVMMKRINGCRRCAPPLPPPPEEEEEESDVVDALAIRVKKWQM